MRKNRLNRIFFAAILLFAGTGLTLPVARAQDAEAPAAAPPAVNGKNSKKAVSVYLQKWSKITGITLLSDTITGGQQIILPDAQEEATPETIETNLTALTRRLPAGTLWAKIYLPAGKTMSGDAVAQYALAQATLFGGVGAPTPAGTIEVMGQKISGEKADAVAAALNLKPVYITLNTNRRSVLPGANAEWNNMTPEQKQQYSKKQAQDILAMDPAQRQQGIRQMMEQQSSVMQALMQTMTPQQRQEFFQSMRQMMPGGMGGPGGRPGRP